MNRFERAQSPSARQDALAAQFARLGAATPESGTLMHDGTWQCALSTLHS
jgi:hypothetical protein